MQSNYQIRPYFVILFIWFANSAMAQLPMYSTPQPTDAQVRMEGYEQRKALIKKSIVNAIQFRNLGPSVMSGRVTDIAVNPADPTEFYVAYASGGLWHTTSNGSRFTPIFDQEAVMTIGDIAVNWQTRTIWVGTGENNSSRSSYSGVGMYRSNNNGKTWQHLGLAETHHIGRIALHPTDSNTVWVAALGHLYSKNTERGIFKTTDGGKSWQHTQSLGNNTGAIDLIIDAQNPNTLYAATWERSRRAWDFVESGEGSAIYKSTDGGDNWSKITGEQSGFPSDAGVGRIGITQYQKEGKNILYAILDNQNRRPQDEGSGAGSGAKELTKEDFKNMPKEDFLKIDEKQLHKFLENNGFPKKYSAQKVMQMVKTDQIKPTALVEYLEDANRLLFDTPVIGLEVYRSDDGGKTWQKTHKDYIDNVYNSYGYYFGQIRVSPHSADKIYIMGVPILRSTDGGQTFKNINGANVHVDHHALWLNPNRDGHLINGNDGGINISYDDGETWFKCNSPAVGQFYAVNVDMAKPYNVYGGFQDNGVWVGPSTYQASDRWHNTGQYPYKGLLGGDGMQVAIDTRDNNTVYTGFQFGYYYRINKATGKREFIRPQHELGERPLRFNWQSPIHLSIHNQDILYFGANKVFRSLNKGEDLTAISPDLTNGGKKGDVPYGTISTIHESPLKFGLLYVGTDDGKVQVSRDGGNNWQDITPNTDFRTEYWISRVQASAHKEGRVYASLNGYRWDNFQALLFVSDDYGNTWELLGMDLPAEPINVVREDPKSADIIYVGTDHGLYVSLDQGATFMAMNNNLPAVAVHDLVIHPRDNDIVVGTHGRSIYIANIDHLQQLRTKDILAQSLHLFEIQTVRHSKYWGSIRNAWSEAYTPSISIPFYAAAAGKAIIKIKSKDVVLAELTTDAQKGLNYLDYDLTISKNASKFVKALQKENENAELKPADNGKQYLTVGEYEVILEVGEGEKTQPLIIKGK